MRILGLIVIFLLHHLVIQAQNSFNTHFEFDSRTSTFRSLIVDRDTILLQGVFVDTIEPFLQGMAFAKVDSFGNLISYEKYYDPFGRDLTFPPLNNIIKISDGRYLTVGMSFQDNALLLIFLTPQFLVDTVYEYFADDPSVQVNWIRSAFEINDGYMLFGSAQRLSFATDGQIIRIDKNGKLLWRKWFGLPAMDEWIGDVVWYRDSTFVIGSFHKPFPVDGDNKMRNTWIFQVDQNGIILNEFQDPDPYSGTSGGLVIDRYHNIYYTGAVIVEDEYGQHNGLGRIGMLNSNFEHQWKTSFGKNLSLNTGFADMILTNEKLIATGTHVDTFSLPGQNTRRPHLGWSIVVSLLGDSICERLDTAMWYLPISSVGNLRALDTLSSGAIIGCGEGRFGPVKDYHEFAWLVKMPSSPCKEFIVNTESPIALPSKLEIYPNPTSAAVSIYSLEKEYLDNSKVFVNDIYGNLVKGLKIETGDSCVVIDFADQLSGLYILKLVDRNGKLIEIRKIIVHRN